MGKKLFLWTIWTGFVVYTILLGPLDQPGTLELLEKLVKLQWSNINPYISTLFSLMGIWPLIYACLMFIDERQQQIPAWPAFLASNGSGIIGMMPYLLLRQPNQDPPRHQPIGVKLLDSRWFGILLSLSTAGLLGYALGFGDWGDFIEQWHTSRFLYLMSLDFCLMCVMFPTLLGDDMARRRIHNSQIFWLVAIVPLLGPLGYLCTRPPLPEPYTGRTYT